MIIDFILAIKWWIGLSVLGWLSKPLVDFVIPKWKGRWIIAKPVGLLLISYSMWILGSLRVLPFGWVSLVTAMGVVTGLGLWIRRRNKIVGWEPKEMFGEEMLFLACFLVWSWIKAHEPTINGLEKFMDFGFTKSILNGGYFPPRDMWFAGETINYYYFGHLMMAVMIKISGINPAVGFNLMLSTLFAMCFGLSFSVGQKILGKLNNKICMWGGLLTGWLVSLSGNLHTIYAFTTGYDVDNPPPFWKILSNFFNKQEFTSGWNAYWYPNATRFIPYTIHEFPSYSFVVSDIHGHVLAIPIVLLLIILLLELWEETNTKKIILLSALFGFLGGTAFMTNALDGPIYVALYALMMSVKLWRGKLNIKKWILDTCKKVAIVVGVFVITALPFLLTFKPFVSGLAVNCPPAFLQNRKIGPLLFETTDKCQKSEWWMILILWGFFVYLSLGLWSFGDKKDKQRELFLVWSIFCGWLIIFPEFFYFKDIYPLHFRSNTMFKLGYQVFILMSIVSGYTILTLVTKKDKGQTRNWFLIFAIPLVFLVSIYPYFSVKSYFGGLKTYQTLNGLFWMRQKYNDDFQMIEWFNKSTIDSEKTIILEADGDSYTDNERVSVFTGLPTIAGWAVHEWLWRGGYDPVGKRITEVREVYTGKSTEAAKEILKKYHVNYIVIGELERIRYPNLNEEKIQQLGSVVFERGTAKIYQVNP